jgi:hypothetical protein
MFKQLVIVIVCTSTISAASPAWSQNSPPVEPPAPQSDRQYTQDEFSQLLSECQIEAKNKDGWCRGDVARKAFLWLGKKYPNSTVQVKPSSFWYIKRNYDPRLMCFANDQSDGDPIVSMTYQCWPDKNQQR